MTTKKVSMISIYDGRWQEFINLKEEAMIFHHPGWLLNLCESYNFSPFVIAVINDDNSISAGVPFAEIKSLITGHRWVSLPYSDYCFPLYNDADDLELMIDFILELYNSSQAPKMELRWEYPVRQGIQQNCHQVIHMTQLPGDPQEWFNNLPKAVRKYIRSSSRRGVTVKRGTSIQFVREYYKLQLETRARHGVPIQPWCYFKLLQKNLLEKDMGFVFLAFSEDGHCIAGDVVLHWNYTYTVKYGASHIRFANELRPGYLLMWESIKWACNNGYKKFDGGRSSWSNTGLREYKNKWALEEKPLTYSTIGYSQRPFNQSGLWKFSEKIIQCSPPIVCRIAGELLYKHFS